MLIDTHAHLNFNAYKDDADEVIRRSLANGIWMINVGSTYETSKKAVEIAKRYAEGVFAAIGLHPIHLAEGIFKTKSDTKEVAFQTKNEHFDYEKYKELAHSASSGQAKSKVVAIGEIGLDYYYRPKIPTAKPSRTLDEVGAKKKLEEFKNKQKETLLKQLELARELNLPIIFHCRMAHNDLIQTLQHYNNTTIRGVIHCFTGNQEQAEKYLEMGFYLSFNGIIFKLKLDEIIQKTPLDKILIETDCPYLTPPSMAGRNEPLYIKYVAEKIAKIKNLSYEEIAEITTENSKKLFQLPKE